MAEASERAAAALKVRGTDVVKEQRTIGEVTVCERILDILRSLQQPVQRAVEVRFIQILVQTEDKRQRRGGSLLPQSARCGEFGRRFEDASYDHGHDKVA